MTTHKLILVYHLLRSTTAWLACCTFLEHNSSSSLAGDCGLHIKQDNCYEMKKQYCVMQRHKSPVEIQHGFVLLLLIE